MSSRDRAIELGFLDDGPLCLCGHVEVYHYHGHGYCDECDRQGKRCLYLKRQVIRLDHNEISVI